MNTETLYLVIGLRQRGWQKFRINRISRKNPRVKPNEAVIKLNLNLPNDLLRPPTVSVDIKPEHVAFSEVKINPEKP